MLRLYRLLHGDSNNFHHPINEEPVKVYISLPITGHDLTEVRRLAEEAKQLLTGMDHEPVSPLDVSPNPDATYAEHIGRYIAALLECDTALFLNGWESSRGCNLEMEAARIYGKEILFEYQLK